MRTLILSLAFFTTGFFVNNYYFERAWTVENLIEASATQAKMSYIRGCVETNKIAQPEEVSYAECEDKSQVTYNDTIEILSQNPELVFRPKGRDEH